MAVTAATIIAGLSKAPAIAEAAKAFMGVFRGDKKEEAAIQIGMLVQRSTRRLDTIIETLEAMKDDLNPTTAILCRNLIEESRADDEQLLVIANRLSDKSIRLPGEAA